MADARAARRVASMRSSCAGGLQGVSAELAAEQKPIAGDSIGAKGSRRHSSTTRGGARRSTTTKCYSSAALVV
eukprot:4578718-Pleurochrysis_carterae.AAC.2